MKLLHIFHGGRSREQAAFTLTELIVTLAALCVFIGILLPAFGGVRRKSGALECKENLRQVGVAINAYAADHSDSLPGPSWRAAYYKYKNSGELTNGMAYYLWSYMGRPAPTSILRTNETLRCPAARQIEPPTPSTPLGDPASDQSSYLVAKYVTNSAGMENRITNVFGNPGDFTITRNPAKQAAVLRPSENWAMVDLDQQNGIGGTYFSKLSKTPVHNERPSGGKNGATRNYLYFDGSVRTMTDEF